jgi:flagellar motor component MotA
MINARSALAVGLTLAALLVFLATIAMGGALQARLAPWPGIGIIVLTLGAFALSWKQSSFLWQDCWLQSAQSAWFTDR